ncbi:cupin domain-containing protein [Orrella marina]|uniref:Cupin n=1 Tax=Orrella marina TaxID=2163011 RepID=A0A2R4XFE8_9BURK|nr:cupin [Orrella marina]AWB32469.1 cupin [Orrella marina]
MGVSGNLFHDLLSSDGNERFDQILALKGVRIERIVSHGHACDPGFWYDQSWDEWVLVIRGSAVLELVQPAYGEGTIRSEGVACPDLRGADSEGCDDAVQEVRLNAGDHLLIPAHLRHRVQSTSPDEPTVWLAIHWDAGEGSE